MSDGKVQLVGGKVLVSAAGKVATAEDCCCECCGKDQPSCVVTEVSGSCDAGCSQQELFTPVDFRYAYSDCGFEWFVYTGYNNCIWVKLYNVEGKTEIMIMFNCPDHPPYGTTAFYATGFDPIPCSGGHLTGELEVPGIRYWPEASFDCTGCTATIVFGP